MSISIRTVRGYTNFPLSDMPVMQSSAFAYEPRKGTRVSLGTCPGCNVYMRLPKRFISTQTHICVFELHRRTNVCIPHVENWSTFLLQSNFCKNCIIFFQTVSGSFFNSLLDYSFTNQLLPVSVVQKTNILPSLSKELY